MAYFWKGIISETIALQLRRLAVTYVSEHWNNFGDVLSVALSEGNIVIDSPQKYAQYTNTSGVYGGEAEIIAMSEILTATIIIYFRERPHTSPRVYNSGQHLYI